MPRTYNLGRRADAKVRTRSAIVTAALELYRDRGPAGASYLAVARAADVAPATVRNHFPEAPDLARAVFEAMLAELRVPTATVLDGIGGLTERVRRLAEELAAFYERSEGWWRVYERDPELIDAWSGGLERYYADIDQLMRTALLELGSDERSVAVVVAVIGPPTFFALRVRGMRPAEAVALCMELAGPWLERRRAELSGSGTASAASGKPGSA